MAAEADYEVAQSKLMDVSRTWLAEWEAFRGVCLEDGLCRRVS